MGETTTLEVVISGRDQFTATANKVGGSLRNLEKTAGAIGGHLSRGLRTAGQNIERLAAVAAGLAVGGGALAVKWAGDFEAGLNTINTIAFTTPEGLRRIGDGIRDIAKTTGISVDELSGAYYELLSAGVKTADAQSILNDAVTLGIGGLASTTEAVDLLTTAYNAYGLDAAGAARATDMFAQAVADGKVKASEIAATFSDVASIARTYSIGIDQIAASYAYLTAKGVAAGEVTTQMQRAIISLIKPLPALELAQKRLKINFTDEIRTKGLVPALQELRVYADRNKIPLIELLGRVEAVKYALNVTGPNFAGFRTELDRIKDSAGEAAKQMGERQQGFNFQLARLKANVHDAGITIGTELLPILGDLAKQFADFLKGHPGDIKAFAVGLADAFKEAVEWARKLDFKSIGDSLKGAAGFAKGIIDVFLRAPDWLKQAVITGWGLNKLTGGAVTNIFADVVKGIGGQFLSRGSNPGNPLFVKDVGLGGGVGGGGALSGLLKATIVGAVVVEGFSLWAQSMQAAIDENNALAAAGMTPDQAAAFKYANKGYDYRAAADKHGYGPGSHNNPLAVPYGTPTSGGLSPDDRSNPSWDTHSETRSIELASIAATRANTAAVKTHSQRLVDSDKRWVKALDKGIVDRGIARFGHSLGSAAFNATYQRDIVHRADSIVRHTGDTASKIERLKALMRDAKLATDATRRTLSADIKHLQAAIRKQGVQVTVNANTSVVLNGRRIAQANSSLTAYGLATGRAGGQIQ